MKPLQLSTHLITRRYAAISFRPTSNKVHFPPAFARHAQRPSNPFTPPLLRYQISAHQHMAVASQQTGWKKLPFQRWHQLHGTFRVAAHSPNPSPSDDPYLPPSSNGSRGAGSSRSLSAAPSTWGDKIKHFIAVVARWLARAAFAAVVLVISVPYLLSTPPGLAAGLTVANQFTPGRMSVVSAAVRWHEPAVVKGFKISERGSDTVLLSAQAITTSKSPWQIVSGDTFDLVVVEPFADVSLDNNGRPRIEQLMNKPPNRPAAQFKSAGEDTVSFSGELYTDRCHVYTVDGKIRAPQELSSVLGGDFHAWLAAGEGTVEQEAQDVEMDSSVLLEADEKPGGGVPVVCSVSSRNLKAELYGWKLPRNTEALAVQQPPTIEVQFTPELARYGLSSINPLLNNVIGVKEETINIEILPKEDGLIGPDRSYVLRLHPMKITVGQSSFLERVLQLVELKGRPLHEYTSLDAETSTIEVEVAPEDTITCKRMDMRLGGPRGVHLCAWGTYNLVSRQIDMNLGLTGSTLPQMGLRFADDDAVLVIPVKGTMERPEVDWARASRNIASAVIQHRILPGRQQSQQLLGRWLGGSAAEPQTVPQPISDLPWE